MKQGGADPQFTFGVADKWEVGGVSPTRSTRTCICLVWALAVECSISNTTYREVGVLGHDLSRRLSFLQNLDAVHRPLYVAEGIDEHNAKNEQRDRQRSSRQPIMRSKSR